MEARQAEEEIFETPDLAEESDSAGSAAIRLSRGLYQEREADPESLVPTSIDADSAFEVFHGKVFDGPRVGEFSRQTVGYTSMPDCIAWA